MATKEATLTIAVGERILEVSIKDARSLGFVANGAGSQLEDLYDGRGNLKDPDDERFAEDLISVMKATRRASRS